MLRIPILIHNAMTNEVATDIKLVLKLSYKITALAYDKVAIKVLCSRVADIGTVVGESTSIFGSGMGGLPSPVVHNLAVYCSCAIATQMGSAIVSECSWNQVAPGVIENAVIGKHAFTKNQPWMPRAEARGGKGYICIGA
ncbi:MAG: hypothetical protein ACFFCW_45355 [Candidatus Hodarchaeota archaeon]